MPDGQEFLDLAAAPLVTPAGLPVDLAADLPAFVRRAEEGNWNGIVGRIENYDQVSAKSLMQLAVDVAGNDVRKL